MKIKWTATFTGEFKKSTERGFNLIADAIGKDKLIQKSKDYLCKVIMEHIESEDDYNGYTVICDYEILEEDK